MSSQPFHTGAIWDSLNGIYSPGEYTVRAECNLNGMKDNYKNNGEDFVGKTVSQNYTVTIDELSEPIAEFTAIPNSGTPPLFVQFTDTSAGSPTNWDWNFGDGNISDEQNPSHMYYVAGTYDVSLNATNSAGSNTTSKLNYITVSDINGTIFDIFEKFPRNSQGENGIYLQYLENGVYTNLPNFADYHFAIFTGTWWVPSIADAYKLGGGYPGYPPQGINAHPTAINQVGLEADTIIRITVPAKVELSRLMVQQGRIWEMPVLYLQRRGKLQRPPLVLMGRWYFQFDCSLFERRTTYFLLRIRWRRCK